MQQGQGFWQPAVVAVSSMEKATEQFERYGCNPAMRFTINAQPAWLSFDDVATNEGGTAVAREFTYLELAMYWGVPAAVSLACERARDSWRAEQLPALCNDLQRSVATTADKLTIVQTLRSLPQFNAVIVAGTNLLATLQAQLQETLVAEQEQLNLSGHTVK
jgi:hypothetical protein